ncbi:2548_t:CDS:2, partial [Ambispora leptoticha]
KEINYVVDWHITHYKKIEYQTASHDEYGDIFNDSIKIILNEDLTEEPVNSENLAKEMKNVQENINEADIATYTMDLDYKPPVELNNLCFECQYPYNEKDLIENICNECYKESTLPCVICQNETLRIKLKRNICEKCFEQEIMINTMINITPKCNHCKNETPANLLQNGKCNMCRNIQEKDEIQEIPPEEFKPKEAKQKEEEFNFEKIKRTEIEQIKENIINLQRLVNEQAKHIRILKQAIEIHQLMFNELNQENINLKRKFEEFEEKDYLSKLRNITLIDQQ